ncbi:MAG: sigma-E processing peptidase SpoIIGA [Bacillota bacterium]
MESYIYADVVLLLEGGMHVVLLFATGRFSGMYRKFWRIFLGGMVSSLCNFLWLLLFFPKNGGVLLLTISMTAGILVAYTPKTIQQFTKLMFFSFFTSFLLSGGINVLVMIGKQEAFFRQGVLLRPPTVSWYYLLWSVLFAYVLLKYGERVVYTHVQKRQNFCTVLLKKDGKSVEGLTLIDTGNGLKHEKKGVVIMEFPVLFPLFSKEESMAILTGDYGDLIAIPYASLGNPTGELFGFFVEECVLRQGNRSIVHKKVLVGIGFDGFKGSYEGLTPISLFEEDLQ